MRYIGAKTKLIDIIDEEIYKYCGDITGKSFCDIFSGTCAVGDHFQNQCNIIANDSLYFCYILARGKLLKHKCCFSKLGFDPFDYFNKAYTDNYDCGYCYNNFAPTVSGRQYFSDENAKFIDFIRDTLEDWLKSKKISEIEHDYLLACLLESASKVSNVAGVYAAFLHIWDSRAVKRMIFIPVESETFGKYNNEVFNSDVNELIKNISGNILYLDPPYTPTQYISQYHVLETIAKNDKPITHGVGAHRDNGNQISKWCKKYYVPGELENLIANAKFDYIIMSYSDAGILSQKTIEAIFKRYAEPGSFVFKKISFIKYKNTRAVNREIKNHTEKEPHYEWLFMMKKAKKPLYISPLNYIGGKYDVLGFLNENFPSDISTFYDLFGGGGTVVLNSTSNNCVYNDLNWIVKDLLETLKTTPSHKTYEYVDKTIKKYGLTKGNKEAYVAFRDFYNSKPVKARNPLDLYLLICFGFEHQIRFNSELDFNNPCGNSGFNDEMLEKLISYHRRANEIGLVYSSSNYSECLDKLKNGDFVYCDPPYLLTCGAYNDGKRGFNGWDFNQQELLLIFLDEVDKKGIKFCLSNIISRDEQTNEPLLDWVKRNKYHLIRNKVETKRNRQDRLEIIIKNY